MDMDCKRRYAGSYMSRLINHLLELLEDVLLNRRDDATNAWLNMPIPSKVKAKRL